MTLKQKQKFQCNGCKKGFPIEELTYNRSFKKYFCPKCQTHNDLYYTQRGYEMTDTWQSKEWKSKAAEFIKGKSCEWCGSTENLVPHHPRRKQ